MKASPIQVRGFTPTGMLELWNIGHAVKLFCAIMGSGLRLVEDIGIAGLENQNGYICIGFPK
jgi:hypothetical protein